MQKRFLGSSDIEVSVIGLGTVKFGRNQGVKYPAAFELPTDAEIKNLLALSSELGINLLDTAPAYGSSEERLGKLIQRRSDWVITTKVGEEFIDGESKFDFSSRTVIQSIERSLRRLKTDYLDIVLVHSNGDDMRIIEQDNVFITLAKLKEIGKIRAFGMSTKTIDGGLKTIESSDLAMVTYNKSSVEDKKIIHHAYEMKKGIFIKKALSSGHIQIPIVDNMRFILAEPGVTSIIVGTLNLKHLQENVESVINVIPAQAGIHPDPRLRGDDIDSKV